MDPVDIVNLGLGFIGRGPIASLDEATKLGARVKGAFPGLRDKVLEDRDWSFAIERRQVQRKAGAPAWGYSAWYELPGDVLRVVEAREGGAGGTLDAFAAALQPDVGNGLDWRMEGRHIVANTGAAQLNIRAVVRKEDPALWSPSFCQALAARLARDLCLPLTENAGLFRDMAQLYLTELSEAAANDGRQGRTEVVRKNTLAARRYR